MRQIHTFYVPTFDHDGEFVREIVVEAPDAGSAADAALAGICSGETEVGEPKKLTY